MEAQSNHSLLFCARSNVTLPSEPSLVTYRSALADSFLQPSSIQALFSGPVSIHHQVSRPIFLSDSISIDLCSFVTIRHVELHLQIPVTGLSTYLSQLHKYQFDQQISHLYPPQLQAFAGSYRQTQLSSFVLCCVLRTDQFCPSHPCAHFILQRRDKALASFRDSRILDRLR